MNTSKEIAIPSRVPRADRLPDNGRFKNRFKINSESSDAVYMVSYDSAENAGWWTCSCRGNIRNGHCKHLDTLGLLTRRDVTQRRLR